MHPNRQDPRVPAGHVAQVNQRGRAWSPSSGTGDASVAKRALASKLNTLLDESGLSQTEAAQLLGMPQPKVSAIKNYKLRGISLERLMQALLVMGQQVEIVVTPCRNDGRDDAIRVGI